MGAPNARRARTSVRGHPSLPYPFYSGRMPRARSFFASARIRRRSSSVVPPHTPGRRRSAMASRRHGRSFTGHTAQTLFANAHDSPFDGNHALTLPACSGRAHSPCRCHAGIRSTPSNIDGESSPVVTSQRDAPSGWEAGVPTARNARTGLIADRAVFLGTFVTDTPLRGTRRRIGRGRVCRCPDPASASRRRPSVSGAFYRRWHGARPQVRGALRVRERLVRVSPHDGR